MLFDTEVQNRSVSFIHHANKKAEAAVEKKIKTYQMNDWDQSVLGLVTARLGGIGNTQVTRRQ